MKFSEKMIRVAFGMLIGGSIIAGSSYIAGACTSVSFDNGAIQLHKNDKVITLNSLNYNPGQSKEINEELSAFDEIKMDVDCMDVEIVSGDSFKIEANYYEKEEKISYEVKDGTLYVEQKLLRKNNNHGGGIEAYIKIYVPRDTKLKETEIVNECGNVKVAKIEIANLNVKTDAGNIEISGKFSGDNEILTEAGNIKMQLIDTKRKDFNYDVETAMGELYLEEKTIENEYAFGGHIEEDNDADNDLKVKTEVGNIEITLK